MQFTPEQQAIIRHSKGHAKVGAVAGSGKTTTMVERVAHLVEQGVEPARIMVLMFNKSAQTHFEKKLKLRLKTFHIPKIWTFNAFGYRLIQVLQEAQFCPPKQLLSKTFGLQLRYKGIVAKAMKQANIESKEIKGNVLVEVLFTFVDAVKSDHVSPEKKFSQMGFSDRYRFLIDVYKQLASELDGQNKILFSDQIKIPVQIMQTNPDALAMLTNKKDHIIVDEYQDVNEIQQQLIRQIAGTRAQVMVVGDVDQCIYAWRGAQPEYMLRKFNQDFSGTTDYLLTRTFRYGHRLALMVNNVITRNRQRDDKISIAAPGNPDTRISIAYVNPKKIGIANGYQTVKSIRSWIKQGRAIGEVAVLVRLHAQATSIQLECIKEQIPYRLDGGEHIMDLPEIDALLGVMRYVDGSLFNNDFHQAGIFEYLAAMIKLASPAIDRQLLSAFTEILGSDPKHPAKALKTAIKEADLHPFSKKQQDKFADRIETLRGYRRHLYRHSKVITLYLSDFEVYRNIVDLSLSREQADSRCLILGGLAAYFKAYQGDDLYQHIAQIKHAQKTPSTTDSLLITSCHRSKGLEFPLVILPSMYEGGFPYQHSKDVTKRNAETFRDEDERRLFYVAATRAMEQLILIAPDDPALKKQLSSGSEYHSPKTSIEANDEKGSRYLYESDLMRADIMGEWIGVDSPKIGPPADYEANLRQYLTQVGNDRHAGKQQKENVH